MLTDKHIDDLAKRFRVERNHYLAIYPHLLDSVEVLIQSRSRSSIYAIAQIIYGWMPTILKNIHPAKFNVPIDMVLDEISALEICSDGKAFIKNMADTAPINNSWVGTSKFLHFINPAIFPIWDSRVASHFNKRQQYQINNKESYADYFLHCHAEKTNLDLMPIQQSIEDVYGYKISLIRAIELVYFETPAL